MTWNIYFTWKSADDLSDLWGWTLPKWGRAVLDPYNGRAKHWWWKTDRCGGQLAVVLAHEHDDEHDTV